MHLREVDDDTVVAHRFAGPAVAAATHRGEQIALARKRHRMADVLAAKAARDKRRALVMHAIPDFAGVVVFRVSGENDRAGQAFAQLPDGRLFKFNFCAIKRDCSKARVGLGCDRRLAIAPGKHWNGCCHTGSNCRAAEFSSVHFDPQKSFLRTYLNNLRRFRGFCQR